jgi:hypothetical protein
MMGHVLLWNFIGRLLGKESRLITIQLVLLNGIYKEKKVKKVEEVMVSLVEQGFFPNMVIYNTFVNGYCQIGDI